jgi:hypothetical protein
MTVELTLRNDGAEHMQLKDSITFTRVVSTKRARTWAQFPSTWLAALLSLAALPSHAVDSASLEIGKGRHTDMVRVAGQWQWDQQWWRSNGTHIGGYWDLSLAQWRAKRFGPTENGTANITDVGLTPVFRLQSDDRRGAYAEIGVGIHYLSRLYNNDGRRLSTRFQFGDHLGVGYVFRNNVDLGLKIQHFSNGSIKKPNDGADFIVLKVSSTF